MKRVRLIALLVVSAALIAACSAPPASAPASEGAVPSASGSSGAASSGAASSASASAVEPSETAPSETEPSEIVATAAPSPVADVTTINGEAPPGEPTAVTSSDILLDTYGNDLEHLVFRDTREPGTRSPIHQHPYGGTTCVLEGQMTLYLEGSPPEVADAGHCYWMPSGLSMTGVSTGQVPAVMLDTFTVPPGEPVWWDVEPGTESIADHNFAPVPHM